MDRSKREARGGGSSSNFKLEMGKNNKEICHMMCVCVTKQEDCQRGSSGDGGKSERIGDRWMGGAVSRPRRQIERMDDNFDLS